MERKPVSNPELAALGSFQGSIERNANFRQQACDHNLGRNVRVVKLLAYIELLRQTGISLAGNIDCFAAIRQNFSSSQSMTQMGLPAGPMQAAHFLPGQIYISGRPIWLYAKDAKTRGQIEFLFAEVEHLPIVFNQADTAAEAKGQTGGLCSGLVKGCRTMIIQSGKNRTSGHVAMEALESAYRDWSTDSLAAFSNALGSKSNKPTVPPLVGDRFEGYTAESISARSTAGSSLWNRSITINVLAYYLEDQEQRRGWSWVVSSCQSVLRDVEAGFS